MLTAIPINLEEANNFVLQHHRHSRPVVGYRFAIGASFKDSLVGVAIVGRPVARMLQDDFTAEVLRTCTNPNSAPKGTNSFLYARCWKAWKAMGGLKLITYTLTIESGASLRGAGWKVIAEVKGNRQWDTPSRPRELRPIYEQQKTQMGDCMIYAFLLLAAIVFIVWNVKPPEQGEDETDKAGA